MTGSRAVTCPVRDDEPARRGRLDLATQRIARTIVAADTRARDDSEVWNVFRCVKRGTVDTTSRPVRFSGATSAA